MTPSLEELIKSLKSDLDRNSPLQEMYRQVASGERNVEQRPLRRSVVILACQAMVILYNEAAKK